MKMVNSSAVTCIFTMLWAVAVVSGATHTAPTRPPSGSPGASPPTASACSTLIYDMMDCMEFLTIGGTETKPEKSCCSGFKRVVDANADCICYGFSASASLGFDINMTRAEALPSACGVSDAPPISRCHATSPSAAKARPPPTMQPPVSASAGAAPAGMMRGSAPAPSPKKSGAKAKSASSFVIFVSFLLCIA